MLSINLDKQSFAANFKFLNKLQGLSRYINTNSIRVCSKASPIECGSRCQTPWKSHVEMICPEGDRACNIQNQNDIFAVALTEMKVAYKNYKLSYKSVA